MEVLLPEQALMRSIATAFVYYRKDVFSLMAKFNSPVLPNTTVGDSIKQLVSLLQENTEFVYAFSELLARKNIIVDVNYRNANWITSLSSIITSTNNMLGKLVGIGRNRNQATMASGVDMSTNLTTIIANMQAEEMAAGQQKITIAIVLIAASVLIGGIIIFKS